MNVRTHPIPSEWLTAYYDGQLDGARRERVEAHLRECAECRAELEAWNALSHALTAAPLPRADLSNPADFWSGVQARLAPRDAAPDAPSARAMLLRWAPGLALLALNGLLQVAAVAGTVLTAVPTRLWPAPEWLNQLYGLAGSMGLGWLAWLVPGNWIGLGVIALSLTVSAGLAVLYLAWLGYEWRYGAAANRRTAA
jgi:hypothetical protein